eukprot:COSAG04_NODE_816_length_10084_cov_4.719179_5_plen_62_part_00
MLPAMFRASLTPLLLPAGRLLANPVKFGDPAKATIPGRASELGAHTQAILEELGMEERPSE